MSRLAPVGQEGGGVIQLNDGKAGMEGLDLDKINKIINDTSKGSKFYEHKRKRAETLAHKIEELKSQLAALSPESLTKATKQVDGLVKELEEGRDLSRVIVHVDMDAFFASVEMRDDPKLKEVPMAVGGNSMLSTSNYHARKFGIRAGMPGFIAKKLCPQLIIVPCNFSKYSAASKEVEAVLEENCDKDSLSMSMDEAVFDISSTLAERNSLLPEHSHLTPEDLVAEIREKIHAKTNLTASAGIAPNGFLAKICSDMRKPNNQFYLESSISSVRSFLKELPLRKVCGIGPVTEQMLVGLEIHTVGDLWEKRAEVHLLFKPATASFLLGVSLGLGSFFSFSSHDEDGGGGSSRKSISCERTFGKAKREELRSMVRALSEELENELEGKGAAGKTITLKIKTINFEVKTRAKSIANWTSSASVLFEQGWSIYSSYEKELPGLQLRLIGLRISNLKFGDQVKEKQQATLSQMFSKQKKSELFQCPVCEQEFGSMGSLGQHVDECLLNSETNQTTESESVPEPSTSTESSTSSSVCPVCGKCLKFKDEEEMERGMSVHVDECLNIAAVKEICGQQKEKEAASTSAKRPRLVADHPRVKGKGSRKKAKLIPIDSYFTRDPK